MTRDRILITGANGELGRTLLRELGPQTAIAATRTGAAPLPEFEHAPLGPDGAPPADALARCRAVINAAGSVTGDQAALDAANVRLPLTIATSAKAAGVAKMVQVSSFAILGTTEYIDGATPEQPVSAYGRSKAEGDRAILALADDGFAVESLRLPFMFSATKPGLLSPLLTLATKMRILPVTSGNPFRRSMLTYGGAAKQLADCAATDHSGKSFAADPLLFDYPLFTSILADEAGVRVRILTIPQAIASGVDRLLPAVGRRLFRSSILDTQANRARGGHLGLENELRRLVRARYNK